jgi:hypothetical protein
MFLNYPVLFVAKINVPVFQLIVLSEKELMATDGRNM